MTLDTVLEKCRDKSVYIYGDGEVGRLTRIFLHEQDIEVRAFVVTMQPMRKELMKLPVYSLSDVATECDDSVFLICMHKKWWEEVQERLNSLGISNLIVIDDKLRRSILDSVEFRDIYEDVEKGRYINTLLYHRVETLKTVSSLIVSPQNFEGQLQYIKSHFDVLRANESWKGVNKKSVVFTFDDGYGDFYRNTYPLLKKYNIPATVFVATGNMDTLKEFWWDRLERIIFEMVTPSDFFIDGKKYNISEYAGREELLDAVHDQVIVMHWKDRDNAIGELARQLHVQECPRDRYRTMNSEEVAALSKDSLITVGAHTVSHILCDCEDEAVQEQEIVDSKEALEKIIGREVNLFAYPNGNIGKTTREILEKNGFIRAFTCVNGCIGYDDKNYDIPRCPVLDWPAEQDDKWFRGMWQTGKDV